MSSSKFVGQLKQNNVQINNLKDQFFKTEAHMSDHEILLSEKVDDFMEKQNSELKSHTQNTDNPHRVTKEQVGLSNLINEEQATKVAFDSHLDDKKNPHAVTKSQVGLGNVDNVQQASKNDFDNHVNDTNIHVSKSKQEKWDAGQLYKLTQDNGKVFYKSSSETTDYNELTTTGMYLIYNSGLNSPGLAQCFLFVMSYGNTLIQSAYDAGNGLKSFYRIRKNDATTWTPWIGLETISGAQEKIAAHASDKDIHVIKSDKDRWDAAQLFKLTSDDGKVFYKGSSEKTEYNDLITTGFYLIANQGLHSPANLSNVYLVVMNYGDTVAQFALEAYYGTHTYFRFRKSDLTWTSWQTHETTDGAQTRANSALTSAKSYTDTKLSSITWYTPTLQNGWVNYTDVNSTDQTVFKTRYTKDATGTVFVEGAIAKGTIGFGVAAFTLPEGYRPGRAFQWAGVASQSGMSGVPQTHRVLVDIDGKVIIESCSNTSKPNDYISLGFSFKAV
ncbi:pyocin knob domain-containing protein [Bacillus nakamurai]|uniref:Terminase n=1 Tax=Bacillus nakamurai TaxID=1793963 RepID=A0A150FAN6_9BACI|nr:pyocin knob domain-containing protein [Bacillus nakamurai]KXZ22307.1 hypothetical protein AXI58_09965 [Bacillus nakamurai]MED1228470.1 pyocin knob domain-containing protein [Bacillus nakamurai]